MAIMYPFLLLKNNQVNIFSDLLCVVNLSLIILIMNAEAVVS